jgi:ferredoxin
MAKITARANGDTTTFEVDDGTRLVLALERNGVDILHKCGGWAKCTTCRVAFESGEPAATTPAEKSWLRIETSVAIACHARCLRSAK